MNQKRVISVIVPDALYRVLKSRAEFNRRSMSGEVVHLIETGLAENNQQTKDLMRLLYQVNGGATLETRE